MYWASLLLFAFSIALSNSTPIFDPPNTENGGFRFNPKRRDVQFGEGIRDWLRNVKSKMGFGNKDISKQVEPPNRHDLIPYRIMEVSSERPLIQSDNFFVNISTLKFDPKTDWGFHVSNWYVIRKAPTTEVSNVNKTVEEWTDWISEKSTPLPETTTTKVKIPSIGKKDPNENVIIGIPVENSSAEVLSPTV